MKNTKAELLAEVQRLQVFEAEADGLKLIAKGSKIVYDDVAYELPLLVHDVFKAGRACRRFINKVELPTFV